MSKENTYSIKEICRVKGGKRLPAGSQFADGRTPFPYLRVRDMVNASINTEDLKYVPKEIEVHIRNYKISKDDLYVTIAGTLGRFGIIPELLDNSQLTENAAKLTDIDSSLSDKIYLCYYLNSQIVKQQINKIIGVGGGVPKLAIHRIESIEVFLPPLPQQKIIAKTNRSRHRQV